jgi:hypothetical protein
MADTDRDMVLQILPDPGQRRPQMGYGRRCSAARRGSSAARGRSLLPGPVVILGQVVPGRRPRGDRGVDRRIGIARSPLR